MFSCDCGWSFYPAGVAHFRDYELLHVHMPWLEELIGDNTHLFKMKEQALTLIANALVEAKYGGK